MSFWDNVKKFAQPYSDDEYDDYEEEMDDIDDGQEPTPRARRSSLFTSSGNNATTSTPAPTATANSGFNGQILNMNSGKQEVVLFHAKTFDDAAKASDELRRKKAVILNMENIGARRLHTIIEKLIEDISFNAPELSGQKIVIDKEMVNKTLKVIVENNDLSKYIL